MADTSYLTELFGLTNKVAIMTGGTGGLGTGMAIALAKSGATIISIEIPDDPHSQQLQAAIQSATGKKVATFTCDVLNANSLRGCFAEIWAQGISPDILVNCAGVIRRNKCEDATDEEIDLVSKSHELFLMAHKINRFSESMSEQLISQPRNSDESLLSSTSLERSSTFLQAPHSRRVLI
jgi:NAD(P)-dependent dehydrogenase (short-subunit alcohol dehydrogenase family)